MRFWLAWCLAMMAGELVGFGFAGALGWSATLALGEGAVATLVIVAAGAVEGVCIGLAQGLVLRRALPDASLARWTFLTALAATLAWAAGMSLGGRAPVDAWWFPVAAIGFLLAIGALMGLAQWFELRRHVRQAARWIAANALVWPLGLVPTYLVSSLMDAATPAALVIAGVALAGAAMGIIVGGGTGWQMQRLARHPA